MAIKNFDKVELLLPMTGANNGTVFTDYSLRENIVARRGNPLPVTSTAQSKFSSYGSSGSFQENSLGNVQGALSIDVSSAAIGSGPFTFGAWVRISDNTVTCFFLDTRANSTFTDAVFSNNAFSFVQRGLNAKLAFVYDSGPTTIDSLSSFVNNEWTHIELSRDADSVMRAFFNGEKEIELSAITNNFSNPYFTFGGTLATSVAKNRWMQDMYFVKGVALHTADFTPPARMTQRELTRTNTGIDSHEYDRAVLFDFNGAAHVGRHTTVIPDASGDFAAADLIDLEYGVAFLKADYDPICRGPYAVDADA